MIVLCREQGPEWLSLRAGKVTASNMAKVMDFRKDGKPGAERIKYLLDVAWELFTGTCVEHYVSKAMDAGTEFEPEARRAYFRRTGRDVKQTGLIQHPTLAYAAASPDGLIGDDGILEIKCPFPSTHRAYIRDGVIPEDYQLQMQFQMLCCGRPWGDFVSFCPPDTYKEITPRTCLFIKRLEADPKLHRQIEEAVTTFMAEVVQMVHRLDAACPELPKVEEAQDEFAGLGAGLDDKDLDQIWPGAK